MDGKKAKQKLKLLPGWFWPCTLVVLGMWVLGPHIGEMHKSGSNPFDSLNALFSALAFLGVIAGIYIQGRELQNQIAEMTRSSDELEEQTAIYRKQLEELTRQTNILKEQRDTNLLHTTCKELPYLVLKHGWHPISDHRGNIQDNIFGTSVSNLEGTIYGVTFSQGDKERSFPKISAGDSAVLIAWELAGTSVRVNYTLASGIVCNETIHFDKSAIKGSSNRAHQVSCLKSALHLVSEEC